MSSNYLGTGITSTPILHTHSRPWDHLTVASSSTRTILGSLALAMLRNVLPIYTCYSSNVPERHHQVHSLDCIRMIRLLPLVHDNPPSESSWNFGRLRLDIVIFHGIHYYPPSGRSSSGFLFPSRWDRQAVGDLTWRPLRVSAGVLSVRIRLPSCLVLQHHPGTTWAVCCRFPFVDMHCDATHPDRPLVDCGLGPL